MAILDDIRRLLENLSRRATAVLPGCERVEFVPATPENERYQPGFIVFEREEPVLCEEHQPFNPQIEQSGDYLETIEHAAEALREQAFEPNHVSLGLDVGADGNPVIAHVSFDYPRTPEQEAIDEGIRLQNERLQEQLNQVRVNTPEFIGNAWSVGGVKVKPIDRLYPHQCQREYVDARGNKKKCPRNLKFEELLLAEANKKLKSCFIDKVFDYLSEKYSQFSYDVRAEWSDIFGKFEYRQYLRKLWKNPHVQFYCCACFRKATLTDVHQAFDTTERDYLEELRDDEEYQAYVDLLQDDICEGTGLSREELFGDRDD